MMMTIRTLSDKNNDDTTGPLLKKRGNRKMRTSTYGRGRGCGRLAASLKGELVLLEVNKKAPVINRGVNGSRDA